MRWTPEHPELGGVVALGVLVVLAVVLVLVVAVVTIIRGSMVLQLSVEQLRMESFSFSNNPLLTRLHQSVSPQLVDVSPYRGLPHSTP